MSGIPAVVFHALSEPYMGGWRALGDRVRLLDIAKCASAPEGVNAAYMRVATALRAPAAVDALRFQRGLEARGIRIVNPIEGRLGRDRKDEYYAVLRNLGFRVPFRITNPTDWEVRFALEAGALRYPFVLRVVDGLQGQQTRLVSGEDDFLQSMKEFSRPKDRVMACEYIPPQIGGYFVKWRPYIFGGAVDMWEATISRRWKATVANNLDFDPADFAAANALQEWPRKWDSMVLSASKALGLEVSALDVIPSAKGPVVVDVNPDYGYACDRIEKENGTRLFDDTVREIRAGHFARFASWLSGL